MKNISSSILLAMAVASSGFAGGPFLSSPGTAIDNVNWSSLGSDGTLFSSGVTDNSTLGNTTTVTLGTDATLGGLTSVVCVQTDPSNCSWGYQSSGYNPGDTLLWFEGLDSNSNAFGTGPVTFSFASNVAGVGEYIQATAAGAFDVTLTLYNGNTVIGSRAYASDGSGHPLFVGADLSSATISSITIAVTSCGSGPCDVNDFSANTLQLYGLTSATPEPATFALAGTLLAWLAARKRFAKGNN